MVSESHKASRNKTNVPLAYFDSSHLKGYSDAAKDSILTAEAIHLDSHHATHLDKNAPVHALEAKQTRGRQRPSIGLK